MKIGRQSLKQRTTSLLPVVVLVGAIMAGVVQGACGGEKELKRDFSGLNPEKCGAVAGSEDFVVVVASKP